MSETIEKFNELIFNQIKYGGQKYASQDDNAKESTDLLIDKHGFMWLIGTIDKYTFRYRNLERERDLLKISSYMYLLWLKRGFHLKKNGSDDPVSLSVEIKTMFSDDFVISSNNFYKKNNQEFSRDTSNNIRKISSILATMSNAEWNDITEDQICEIYSLVFSIWYIKYYVAGKAGLDTDTNNEQKAIQEKIESFLRIYLDQRNNEVTNPNAEFKLYSFDKAEVSFLSEKLSENLTSKKGNTSASTNQNK